MSALSRSGCPMTRKRMLFLSSVFSSSAQVVLEQAHQRGDLGVGPLPVLDGERVERQHRDAEPRRGLDRIAHGLDAGAVAFDARQMAGRGPSAVAVHDDGDVARQPGEIHLAHERLFGRPGGTAASTSARAMDLANR